MLRVRDHRDASGVRRRRLILQSGSSGARTSRSALTAPPDPDPERTWRSALPAGQIHGVSRRRRRSSFRICDGSMQTANNDPASVPVPAPFPVRVIGPWSVANTSDGPSSGVRAATFQVPSAAVAGVDVDFRTNTTSRPSEPAFRPGLVDPEHDLAVGRYPAVGDGTDGKRPIVGHGVGSAARARRDPHGAVQQQLRARSSPFTVALERPVEVRKAIATPPSSVGAVGPAMSVPRS